MKKKITAKTVHEKHKLSFAELGALLGTRNLLAANLITHTDDAYTNPGLKSGEHMFNMGVACVEGNCGSVGCIGGTMAQIMGMKGDEITDYVHSHDWRSPYASDYNSRRPIAKLFFPPMRSYRHITNEHAVKAIDNFLNDGHPRWDQATS